MLPCICFRAAHTIHTVSLTGRPAGAGAQALEAALLCRNFPKEVPAGTKLFKFAMDRIYQPFYFNLMISDKSALSCSWRASVTVIVQADSQCSMIWAPDACHHHESSKLGCSILLLFYLLPHVHMAALHAPPMCLLNVARAAILLMLMCSSVPRCNGARVWPGVGHDYSVPWHHR